MYGTLTPIWFCFVKFYPFPSWLLRPRHIFYILHTIYEVNHFKNETIKAVNIEAINLFQFNCAYNGAYNLIVSMYLQFYLFKAVEIWIIILNIIVPLTDFQNSFSFHYRKYNSFCWGWSIVKIYTLTQIMIFLHRKVDFWK